MGFPVFAPPASRRRWTWRATVAASASAVSVGAAQAQSFNEMASEASAQQFYDDVQRRISASTHDGPTYYLSRDYTLTPEQEAYLEQRRRDDEELNRLRSDPVLMRHVNGYWQHYQSRDGAAPGEFCAATYNNLHGSITLSGVDGSWEGGLLTFIGDDIPRPDAFRQITVTLTQTGDRPATVRVFNPPASPEMDGHGTMIFAVPAMADALAGMSETQEFAISYEGAEVFRMTWKGGRAARETLRRCVRKRQSR